MTVIDGRMGDGNEIKDKVKFIWMSYFLYEKRSLT